MLRDGCRTGCWLAGIRKTDMHKLTVAAITAFIAILSLGAYDLNTPLCTPITEKNKPAGTPMTFVKDGKYAFAIVIDQEAEKRVKNCKAAKSIAPAVKLVADEFEKIYGARPEILDEGDEAALAKYQYRLVIGESKSAAAEGLKSADIPDQGFVIKSFEKGLVIIGNDSSLLENFNALTKLNHRGSSRGTFYGACDFVNRFLGVVHFFPGEYGTLRPAAADLVISPVHYADKPYFNMHGADYHLNCTLNYDAKKWEPFIGKVREEERCWRYWRHGGTNPLSGEHYPEPFCMQRLHPDKLKTIFYTTPKGRFWCHPTSYSGNYYNVIDLGFADILVEDYKKIIATDGKYNWGPSRPLGGIKQLAFGVTDVAMTPQDVLGDPTVEKLGLMTEKDLALGSDRAFANIYGRFHQYLARRVKEELPEAKLWLMPYYNCYYAPTDPKWTLPDNVEINFCARDFPLYTRSPDKVAKTITMLKDWYKILGNRPAQKIWLYNDRDNLSARAVAGEFVGEVPKVCGKYLGTEGGMFMDFDGHWGLWHHYYSLWACSMSQWNPDFDVDAAIDAHWPRFYGEEAGKWLCKFHRLLKEAYLKYYINSQETCPQYPLSYVEAMEECLAKAKAALKPGTPEMKRYELIAAPWPAEFAKRRILAEYKPQVYRAARIKVGTKPDAAFWAALEPVKLFDPKGSKKSIANRADIKLAWDEKNLYVHCEGFYPVKAKEGVAIWNNDTLECFFSPGLGKEVNYQIATDPVGGEWTQFKRYRPVQQPADRTWRPKDLKFDCHPTEKGWLGDITIPFEGFSGVKTPLAGERWNFNVVRTASLMKPSETAACSLTMGNNHDSLMYAILEFGE